MGAREVQNKAKSTKVLEDLAGIIGGKGRLLKLARTVNSPVSFFLAYCGLLFLGQMLISERTFLKIDKPPPPYESTQFAPNLPVVPQ